LAPHRTQRPPRIGAAFSLMVVTRARTGSP
jgi:hypothetical protein